MFVNFLTQKRLKTCPNRQLASIACVSNTSRINIQTLDQRTFKLSILKNNDNLSLAHRDVFLWEEQDRNDLNALKNG